MKVSSAAKALLSRAVPILVLAVAAAAVLAPTGVGFSTGITKEKAPAPDAFAKHGCLACHGDQATHAFQPLNATNVDLSFTDDEGQPLNGHYEADHVYTATIRLQEQNAPGEDNHAGFNLRASAGKLAGVAGSSSATADGAEATHEGPGQTSWTVQWTAPAEGPVVFTLFVNDVDGSGANDAGDQVYRVGFYLTDKEGAVPGAVKEEHVEFGISLQQYWIGLIGLFGMIVVMVAAFLYLKFANPHNTDAKDR